MNDRFILEDEIERYLNRITSKILSKKKKMDVKNEYEDYIRESVKELAFEGKSEKEAFEYTISEFGDETKLTELLSYVNKSSFFQKLIVYPLVIVLAFVFLSSYYWIENDSYRSYFTLAVQLVLLVLAIYVFLFSIKVIRAVSIRRKTLLQIKKFAQNNNYKFIINSNSFSSIFERKDNPEWILETEKERYIIYLWSTVKSKKTLRLSSNGLYSYSDNIGYMNLPTNPQGHILTGGAVFCPDNIDYYEKFKNTHSELVELKKGWHLIPDIDWECHEIHTKKNVKVFLLNPVPFKLLCIENGVEKAAQDGYNFCGFSIWSAEGFVSFLKGEKIRHRT